MPVYDLAILGGGPAGVSGGIYAARKKLKTIFITKDFQSQSTVSPDIQNWVGTPSISGQELASSFEKHLRTYAGEHLTIQTGEYIKKVTRGDDAVFTIETDKNTYTAKTILIATGSHRRKLDIPGADTFENKGITYCATCDGPLFSGQDVAVIGGGNAGFETAAQLSAYCKSVTLLHHRDTFKADPITVEKVLAKENVKAITNAKTLEVKGDAFAHTLVYSENSGEPKELAVTGIFVEIGAVPTTEYVKDVVELDEYNRITIDPWTQSASTKGAWAAGDCTNAHYHQNNIAAGDAIKALEDIYNYLHTK